MLHLEHQFRGLVAVSDDSPQNNLHSIGGLFLEESAPASLVSLICPKKSAACATVSCSSRRNRRRGFIGDGRRGGFLSVTVSSGDDGGGEEFSVSSVLGNAERKSENEGESETLSFKEKNGTWNTANHLWAGVVN